MTSPEADIAAELPLVDEHCVEVGADELQTWSATLDVVSRAFTGRAKQTLARLLACDEVGVADPRPLDRGSTLPGFRVTAASPPTSLHLAGRHRFSRYALAFRIEELSSERSRVCAQTRAEFPGLTGAVYRRLVVGTRLHVAVVRGILSAIKRRAEATP